MEDKEYPIISRSIPMEDDFTTPVNNTNRNVSKAFKISILPIETLNKRTSLDCNTSNDFDYSSVKMGNTIEDSKEIVQKDNNIIPPQLNEVVEPVAVKTELLDENIFQNTQDIDYAILSDTTNLPSQIQVKIEKNSENESKNSQTAEFTVSCELNDILNTANVKFENTDEAVLQNLQDIEDIYLRGSEQEDVSNTTSVKIENANVHSSGHSQKIEATVHSSGHSQKIEATVHESNILLNLPNIKPHKTDEEVLRNLQDIEDSYFLNSESNVKLEESDDKIMQQLNAIDYMISNASFTDDTDNFQHERKPDTVSFTNFQGQKLEDGEIPSEEVKQKVNLTVDDKSAVVFQTKLIAKEEEGKKRIHDFSEILKYSYPPMTNWLIKQQEKFNGFFCEYELPRQCPLNRHVTNIWKLIFHKTIIKPEKSTSHDRFEVTSKIIWKLLPKGVLKTDFDNKLIYPEFIMETIKLFETFCNESEDVQRDASKFESTTKANKKEFTEIVLRANFRSQVMALIIGYNVSEKVTNALRNYFRRKQSCIASLYCRSFNPKLGKNKSQTIWLHGQRSIDEVIGGSTTISMKLTPWTNLWSNVTGVKLLAESIHDYLQPFGDKIIFMIGCGIGLIPLILSFRYEQIIGVDLKAEIDEAVKTRDYNKIKNVVFAKDDTQSVESVFNNLETNSKITAIINNNTNPGRSIDMALKLRKLTAMKHIIFLTPLLSNISHRVLLELMRPADEVLGNPFIPTRMCVIDTTPDSDHFQILALMERRNMRIFKQEAVTGKVIEMKPIQKIDDYSNVPNAITRECALKTPVEISEINKDSWAPVNSLSKRHDQMSNNVLKRRHEETLSTYTRGINYDPLVRSRNDGSPENHYSSSRKRRKRRASSRNSYLISPMSERYYSAYRSSRSPSFSQGHRSPLRSSKSPTSLHHSPTRRSRSFASQCPPKYPRYHKSYEKYTEYVSNGSSPPSQHIPLSSEYRGEASQLQRRDYSSARYPTVTSSDQLRIKKEKIPIHDTSSCGSMTQDP